MVVLNSDYEQLIEEYHQRISKTFGEDLNSPLSKEDRENYKGLDYFLPDRKYHFTLPLIEKTDELVEMETNTGEIRSFIKIGAVEITIDNEKAKLWLFKSKDSEYYFLPFCDGTSGKESYGGGRFVTVHKLEENAFQIDIILHVPIQTIIVVSWFHLKIISRSPSKQELRNSGKITFVIVLIYRSIE
ncbi:MAG: DUF1684 domain-containing protein [Candidatus Heimdallarchaeota archaeon]|nr:DUF1684 domain-containing protein [Candidatus Heimdallarchaeota archaeon]